MKTDLNTAILDYLETSTMSKRWFGKVGEEAVKAFETRLDFTLPDQYRAFVKRFGCGNFGAIELFGLGVPDDGIPHAGFVLRQLRSLGASLIEHTLPVAVSPHGEYFHVLCKSWGDFPAGCIITLRNTDRIPQLQHASFSDFLLNVTAEALLAGSDK